MCRLVQYNILLNDYSRNCNSWVIVELVSLGPKVSLTVYTCTFLLDLYLLRFVHTWFSSNYRESWFVNMICKIEDKDTNENLTTSKQILIFTAHKCFLHLCVILFTGEGEWLPRMHHRSHDQGGLHLVWVCIQGRRTASRVVLQNPPPSPRRYTGYGQQCILVTICFEVDIYCIYLFFEPRLLSSVANNLLVDILIR